MPPNNHERNTVSVDCCYENQYETKNEFPTNYKGKLTNSKMAAHVAYPLNHQKDMAVWKDISPQVNCNRIKKIQEEPDENDKPSSYYNEKRSLSDENTRNQELFDIMKYEVNRLNTYTGKWPLCYIKSKDLAQNGFFYLQSEDKVQCAFCSVIIDDWNVGDKPVKKHMMKNPKCIFLLTADAGNVQITKPKPIVKNVNKSIPNSNIRNTPSHKPKYPWMSDMKNRLLSYRDWPLLMLSSRQLAECGLFYTGVGDTVTCYYCGGSLHQWELNDDPWEEHEKAYPDCGFLETRIKPTQSFAVVNRVSIRSDSASARPSVVSDDSIPNEVIRQAGEIFPDSLVQKVAIQHFQRTGKHFTSLHDLCDAILQYKAQEQSALTNAMSPSKDSSNSISRDITSNKAPAENPNYSKINCKVCLDEDINIVFEPCHHQVACEKCAVRVTECPLCRSIITNRIKVFWG